MKIVLLTNKSARAAHILRDMKNRNVQVEAIFIGIQRPISLGAKLRKLRRLGPTGALRVIAKRARKTLAPMELRMISQRTRWKLAPSTAKEWFSNDFYRSYSDKVYTVDDFNGQECEQLLKEIEPDLVILGGTGIIRKNIIDIPKIGILNAHPGLLPKYRGVDVISWAIYHGNPVGVTVHFVDEGIDTGSIVLQEAIGITESDTIESLGKKADRLAGELMAEIVQKVVDGESIEVVPQSIADGKQYHRMPVRQFRETLRRLRKLTEAAQGRGFEGIVRR